MHTTESNSKPDSATRRYLAGISKATSLIPSLFLANGLIWASGIEGDPHPRSAIRRRLAHVTNRFCDRVVEPALNEAERFEDRNGIVFDNHETNISRTNDKPTTWGYRTGGAILAGALALGGYGALIVAKAGMSKLGAIFNNASATQAPAIGQNSNLTHDWRTCAEKGEPKLDLQRANFALGRGGCVVFAIDKGPST